MTQCWAQESDQRPSFHKIQDQLQLFKNFSLNCISQCRDERNIGGVINEGFEGKLVFFPPPVRMEQISSEMHTGVILGWVK